MPTNLNDWILVEIGLIGWRGERAIGLPPDISGQIHYLFKGTLDTQDKYWTHRDSGQVTKALLKKIMKKD